MTFLRWSLEDQDHVEELERLVKDDDPGVLIGSPPCMDFQVSTDISKCKLDQELDEKWRKREHCHLRMAFEFFQKQEERAKCFRFRSSWVMERGNVFDV